MIEGIAPRGVLEKNQTSGFGFRFFLADEKWNKKLYRQSNVDKILKEKKRYIMFQIPIKLKKRNFFQFFTAEKK